MMDGNLMKKRMTKTMSDLIDRKAAIKAIEDLQDCYNGFSDTYDKSCIIGVLEEVPSAEPKIVRCKDCDWWDRIDDGSYGYCHSCKHGFYSANWEISIYRRYKEDFFCADGERRVDE